MDSNHRRRTPADLQSAPFGHSGNFPYVFPPLLRGPFVESRWRDSNPRPPDYKSSALPTELHRHFNRSECKSRYKKCIGKIFCDKFSNFLPFKEPLVSPRHPHEWEAKSGAKIIQSAELTNFSAKKIAPPSAKPSPRGLQRPLRRSPAAGRGAAGSKKKAGGIVFRRHPRPKSPCNASSYVTLPMRLEA